MKILVLYNRTGDIIFTQTNPIDEEIYSCLIGETIEGKNVVGVDVESKTLVYEEVPTSEMDDLKAEIKQLKDDLEKLKSTTISL
nr:MAG TPA: protein of unknown function (DUF5320) [Caudoviricetes sp.]